MNLAAKITLAGSALVVAGLVALAAPAFAGAPAPEPAGAVAPAPVPAHTPWPDNGPELYQAAIAAMPMPLPDGYAYPANRAIPTDEWAPIQVWQDWFSATAHEASLAQAAGDAAAVARYQDTLRAAWDLHFATIWPTYVIDAINEGNFAILLQGFPLPSGMHP